MLSNGWPVCFCKWPYYHSSLNMLIRLGAGLPQGHHDGFITMLNLEYSRLKSVKQSAPTFDLFTRTFCLSFFWLLGNLSGGSSLCGGCIQLLLLRIAIRTYVMMISKLLTSQLEGASCCCDISLRRFCQ